MASIHTVLSRVSGAVPVWNFAELMVSNPQSQRSYLLPTYASRDVAGHSKIKTRLT